MILVPFLSSCQKRLPAEAADVHRGIREVKEDCASVYAQEELASLDILLSEMENLEKKRKYSKMREKALEILPKIKMLATSVQQEKKRLNLQIDKEKEKAATIIRLATEEKASEQALNLIAKAKNMFHDGEENQDDHGCQLSQSLDLFRASARIAEEARLRIIEEKKKLKELEEARKRLEQTKAAEAVKPKEEITEWIVSRGENLWTISARKEIYGDSQLWPLIFWANRSQIKDPNLIYQDQKLKIPREFQKEDLEKARKTSETIIQTSESD